MMEPAQITLSILDFPFGERSASETASVPFAAPEVYVARCVRTRVIGA